MMHQIHAARDMPNKNMSGFTLIELMIVVVIVSILMTVGYPSYQEYGRRAKRAEARALLMDGAARMERSYSNTSQYPTTLTAITSITESGSHRITLGNLGANNQTFTLTAAPNNFTDAKCGNLTLTNTGVRGNAYGAQAECWGK